MKQPNRSKTREKRIKEVLASMRGIKYVVMENESSSARFPLSSNEKQANNSGG